MTLGMLVIARGVTMTYCRRQAGPRRREAGFARLARQRAPSSGCPVPFVLLHRARRARLVRAQHTTFGRHVYAVGDNLEAARLSGIRRDRVIFSVYVISGLCAAVTALIIVSRLTAGEPSQGTASSSTRSRSS